MSFINLQGIQDARELPSAPEGRYNLCITDAKMHTTDNGDSIQMILEIEGEDKFANIFHYVALPNGKDPAKDQMKLLMAKRLFVQFEVPFEDGVEIEQLAGSRGACNLGVDEYQGQLKNVLRLDRLPAFSR